MEDEKKNIRIKNQNEAIKKLKLKNEQLKQQIEKLELKIEELETTKQIDELLKHTDISSEYKIPHRTLSRHIAKGKLKPYKVLSNNRKEYRKSDVLKYIDEHVGTKKSVNKLQTKTNTSNKKYDKKTLAGKLQTLKSGPFRKS